MSRSAAIVAGVLLATTFSASGVRAQPSWNPVDVGMWWTLRSDAGDRVTSFYTMFEELATGATAVRRENQQGTDLYWNYWTEDAGNVYLHGFWIPDDGHGVVYDPPVLWTTADLTVESNWTTVFSATDFQGDNPAPSAVDVAVLAEETVQTYVGSFSARRVEWRSRVPAAKLAGRDLTGARLDPAKRRFADTDWYTLGGGIVQSAAPDDPPQHWLKLGSSSVESRTSSFGAVKALFR